jgi:hypothetical protein
VPHAAGSQAASGVPERLYEQATATVLRKDELHTEGSPGPFSCHRSYGFRRGPRSPGFMRTLLKGRLEHRLGGPPAICLNACSDSPLNAVVFNRDGESKIKTTASFLTPLGHSEARAQIPQKSEPGCAARLRTT